MGIGLAVALLLLIAGEARAGKYAVAQCGWYVGLDASWADTTGGAKFRPDSYCVPGPPADPFDGSHAKTFTRDGQGTVSGTRFGRWRWTAPPGTGITQVSGTWWHTLHDGIEQRLGTDPGDGSFAAFGAAAQTDVTPSAFAVGFAAPQVAFEDRLLCAKAETKWCSLDPGSWSALRAVTLTIVDDAAPFAALGGNLLQPGWHRGGQGIDFWGGDVGGGIRYGETVVDGARVDLAEYPCEIVLIGGEWKGTQMHPCPTGSLGSAVIDTTRFSDGPHRIRHCVTDIAGNVGCTGETTIATDNTAPAHPRPVVVAGGEGWRRVNDFDLTWTNPDQGSASPIAGASWRLIGSAGFDTGVRFAAGHDLAALGDIAVPAPGAYSLQLWLRDEAGNEAPASALTVPLRFDDVAPGVAFAGADGAAVPERLVAAVDDPLSGPASGQILYRRAESERWLELPTKLQSAATPGQAILGAPTPDLAPGNYLFRVDATDGAGNAASSTLRADGTQMAIHKAAPTVTPKAKARLFARLGAHGRGGALTVPFGARAVVAGRLTRAGGAGLAGRELRVVTRPSRGALVAATTTTVKTGEDGGFELQLPPGPSRQVSVAFDGDDGLDPARRPSLDLRVRAGVSLEVAPRSLTTGETLRLSGQVEDRAAPIPRRGKLVEVQYLEEETGRWRPVLVTRSDHDGRFHARYRFRYLSSAATIRLRATALAEERWPYAPGSSAPVTVQVHDR
jgi:hypothetical protein